MIRCVGHVALLPPATSYHLGTSVVAVVVVIVVALVVVVVAGEEF